MTITAGFSAFHLCKRGPCAHRPVSPASRSRCRSASDRSRACRSPSGGSGRQTRTDCKPRTSPGHIAPRQGEWRWARARSTPVALRHERRHSARRGLPSAAGGRATYPNTRCRGFGEGDRAPCRAGRLRASLSSAAARRWRCRPKVGPFSAQKTGETAPSAEDQEKGERNFHPFVEMIRLTLGGKTLQSVGIWRERAPQGGK
jgi:hypothetical protein